LVRRRCGGHRHGAWDRYEESEERNKAVTGSGGPFRFHELTVLRIGGNDSAPSERRILESRARSDHALSLPQTSLKCCPCTVRKQSGQVLQIGRASCRERV